ncbi:MAG: CinA family nicotinamide mononucleotide deamidase-related protein [Bacillota bacterium]|jgi:nicotinamide-nucleotide amidase
MIAEIINVGSEILLGDIVNTNAQFLAQQLARLGISVHYQTVVGDNAQRIKKALDIAFSRAQMVIMTGGLGPTKDDLTKEMLAQYFGKELVFDEKAFDDIKNRMKKHGVNQVSSSNKKQAYFPQDAIILYNENGTAPGCIIEDNHKIAVLLPGPPREMQPMFMKYIDPYLSEYTDKSFFSVHIKLQNIGESMAADKINHLLDYSNPTVAPYAKEDGVVLRITAAACNYDEAMTMINPIINEIKAVFTDKIREIIMPI